jgi:hypothetical protein
VASENLKFVRIDGAVRLELAAHSDLVAFRKGNVIARQAGALDGQTLRAWLRRHIAPFSSEF